MQTHPEIELISRFPDWEFFVTLTFKGRPPKPVQGRKRVFAWLRQVCKLANTPFRSMLWVLREERGEATGRLHYHLLLSKTRLPLNSESCFALMRVWSRKLSNGLARSHVFNRSLCGSAYVSKCLSGEGAIGGDDYEGRKFGTAEKPPELSRSLCSWLSRQGAVWESLSDLRRANRGRDLVPPRDDARRVPRTQSDLSAAEPAFAGSDRLTNRRLSGDVLTSKSGALTALDYNGSPWE